MNFNDTPHTQNNNITPEHNTEAPDTVLQTDFAEVMLVPKISETSDFQMVLQDIPQRVDEANKMLADYRNNPEAFIDAVDEDALDAKLKDMAEISAFVRSISKSRTDMKKFVNDMRDRLVGELDRRLEGAQYGELERAQADIKQLKKDVDADRREARWLEIKDTFVANVQRYPTIQEFAPELTDFSRFKILHPKLVSGAKTRKVKDADHTVVNETVYAWSTAIELIKENEWGLSPQDQNQLLTLFKQNPGIELVRREGRQLKINAEVRETARREAEKRQQEADARAKVEAERRQKELARIQEQERMAKAQRDQAATEKAAQERAALEARAAAQAEAEQKRQAEYAAFGGQYQTIFKESFPQFVDYLFNNKAYHNVHSSPQTKASVIYDIMQQVKYPDSVVTRETAKDPQKVLDLVRYILDA